MRQLSLLVCAICTAALATAAVSQGAVTTNESISLNRTLTLPCNGDRIQLSGTLHIVITATTNGNTVSGMVHHEPQHVVGTDLTTGAQYVSVGATINSFNMSTTTDQSVTRFVNTFLLIGQGSAPNLRVHDTEIVVVNTDGTVTANVDDVSLDCT
jgi:hypothetical protein